ncbi:T9SS type A sorting domain-containing protein [Pontibacter flavimaris]|uniref:Secretion system C-terminal sorting domain-containing protein n=1 Tax=Pontibacter flavimaris TaxID=1797110 RepID=A0A1Q5PFS3_9BACT|nr:T9SS type A sorting domain-containing protein [Pontibacter flavimaris]OKL41066.1 hypothetical protein A3841_14670 [Pontibacter flavimaris]
MKVYLPLLLILLSLPCVLAQQQEPLRFRMSQSIPVSAASGQLAQPWSGGLNSPQFSTIDLNQDGQDDLFAFDRQTAKVYTWLAVQEAGQWKYKYAPAYESMFPSDLAYWALLRDYNCDGLKDIFTNSPLGIRVLRQEPGEPLRFTEVTDGLRYKSGRVNMQMNATDIPAITDIDGDGDLDILLTNFAQGSRLELYQNMQAEQGLPCASLVYEQQSNWWGGITECDGCNEFKFGEQCGSNHGESIAAPLHSGHEGSTHLLLDMDGDGDMELVMGGVACGNLVLMENKGDRQNARMDSFLPGFPAANPASFNLFPAAFYEDITFDGVPDLLVTTQAFEEIHDMDFQRSSWLYQNTGAADKPEFAFAQDDFLQSQMIDLSEGAYPAFADLDGDGDLDMLVGNDASYRNDTYSGSLSFYRNTGTSSEPAFALATDDFLKLHNRQLYSIKPTFADVNGDGRTDLILTLKGHSAGSNRIVWLRNLAATGQPPAFDFARQQELLKIADGDSPAFADLDGDGDLDMLLGKAASNLEFYRNTGTANAPVYTLESSSFGGIGYDFDRRYLHPLIFDVDGDGQLDLLTTDDSGELRIYRHITQDLNATLTPETELLENGLTQQVQATSLGRGLSIAAAPLGDKRYLVLGSKGGGLYLLEQVAGYKGVSETGEKLTLQVYPNPHENNREEPVKVQASEPVQLEVFDMIGKRVYRSTHSQYSRTHSLPVQGLQAGIYIIRAGAESGSHASIKLMVR